MMQCRVAPGACSWWCPSLGRLSRGRVWQPRFARPSGFSGTRGVCCGTCRPPCLGAIDESVRGAPLCSGASRCRIFFSSVEWRSIFSLDWRSIFSVRPCCKGTPILGCSLHIFSAHMHNRFSWFKWLLLLEIFHTPYKTINYNSFPLLVHWFS